MQFLKDCRENQGAKLNIGQLTVIRRTLFFFVIILVSISSSSLAETRPNILFFLVDDQRNDTLGCAGHPIVKTPTIDRLAAEGVRFQNMFVTTSICVVSRASILTGTVARSHSIATDVPSVAPEMTKALYSVLLRQAGYRTGLFGKWHVKMGSELNPEDWFDEFERIFRRPYFKEQPDGTKRHEAEVIGDRAVDFLKSQPKGQPFCLNLWFNSAHAEDGDKRPGIGHYPWPKAVDSMYEDIDMPAPYLCDPAIYESQPEFLKESINRQRYFWRWDTPEKYQTNMRAYFRMLSGVDHVIARVLTELEEQQLADNTIVIYSADNGYYMGDRGFAGKWSHYEQSLRVPLIIYDPRLKSQHRGRVVSLMALNIDLPATFLDWAGVKIPSQYQGRSLAPIVRGDTPSDWRNDFFCEHVMLSPTLTWEGVRSERYVYARYIDQEPHYEFLHDLEKDPDQLKNFVDNPAYKKVLATMRRRCDELVDHYGGPMLPVEERYVKRQPKKRK